MPAVVKWQHSVLTPQQRTKLRAVLVKDDWCVGLTWAADPSQQGMQQQGHAPTQAGQQQHQQGRGRGRGRAASSGRKRGRGGRTGS